MTIKVVLTYHGPNFFVQIYLKKHGPRGNYECCSSRPSRYFAGLQFRRIWGPAVGLDIAASQRTQNAELRRRLEYTRLAQFVHRCNERKGDVSSLWHSSPSPEQISRPNTYTRRNWR